MPGQRLGYVRVSSFEQNPDRQLDGLVVDRLFSDHASGKDTQRPQLAVLLRLTLALLQPLDALRQLAAELSDTTRTFMRL